MRIVRILAAGMAVLFGAATLVAGGRVLLGADPGYEVFRPLLVYNTAMGVESSRNCSKVKGRDDG